MLISAKATDTVYQTILRLLEQHGIDEKEPLQQHVLLSDSTFLGYRFLGNSVEIDWLAQWDLIVGKNRSGQVLFQQKVTVQKNSHDDPVSDHSKPPVAA